MEPKKFSFIPSLSFDSLLQSIIVLIAVVSIINANASDKAKLELRLTYAERAQDDMRMAIRALVENQSALTRSTDKLTVIVEELQRQKQNK